MAYSAGKLGGSGTVCLNASNEEAVFAFLNGQIKLYDIYKIVEKMMDKHKIINSPSIDDIFSIDEEIRIQTKELISKKSF
jgi:1-deoxy-D-xylulose-5-phosphate reductoisomerase